MKNNCRTQIFLAAAFAACGIAMNAHAQSKGDITVESKNSSPYAIDSRGVVWRSGTNLCWRTGTWS
ncbi:MAG TPA: OmpA family protein, partial [Rhodocyclaceae bacterium]|nr:OmpA family protein [Rhodocyclaceae bacterium]